MRLNQEALTLLDGLLRPAPSLGIEHADAQSLRGRILADSGSRDALAAYEESLHLFDELDQDAAARLLPDFHERYADLLVNLATLSRGQAADQKTHQLLIQAVTHYTAHANASLAAGDRPDAQAVADNLARLLPELGNADRAAVTRLLQPLQAQLASKR